MPVELIGTELACVELVKATLEPLAVELEMVEARLIVSETVEVPLPFDLELTETDLVELSLDVLAVPLLELAGDDLRRVEAD